MPRTADNSAEYNQSREAVNEALAAQPFNPATAISRLIAYESQAPKAPNATPRSTAETLRDIYSRAAAVAADNGDAATASAFLAKNASYEQAVTFMGKTPSPQPTRPQTHQMQRPKA